MNQTKLLKLNTKLFREKNFPENDNQNNFHKTNHSSPVISLFPGAKNVNAAVISLNPISIARVLAVSAFILVLASTITELSDFLTGHSSIFLHKLVKLLYVDLELNVPAFFSMLLLLFAALLLTAITFLKRHQAADYVFQWAILSCGFLFMAFDEIIAVHERLIEPMRDILGSPHLGVLYFAWVVPAFALVSFLGVFFLKFLWSLPMKTRISFIVAATLYLGAALGLELFEGSHTEIYGKDNLPYIFLTTLEESLEMAGVIAFIWALLVYIAETCKEVRFRFDEFFSNDELKQNI